MITYYFLKFSREIVDKIFNFNLATLKTYENLLNNLIVKIVLRRHELK